jgi:hypothetical protein
VFLQERNSAMDAGRGAAGEPRHHTQHHHHTTILHTRQLVRAGLLILPLRLSCCRSTLPAAVAG